MLFHVKHNWWDSGLHSSTASVTDSFESPFLKRKDHYLQFLDKRIVLLDNDFKPTATNDKLKVDFIILSKDAGVTINDLANAFDFKRIIFDSSNSEKRIKCWKKDCAHLGIDYYDVNEKGALVV
jgi:hypothetical protein